MLPKAPCLGLETSSTGFPGLSAPLLAPLSTPATGSAYDLSVLALSFLKLDKRPIFILQSPTTTNSCYRLLFQNPASRKVEVLNDDALHQSVSEMPESSIKMNGWRLDITILADYPELRIMTANRPRVNSDDFSDSALDFNKDKRRAMLAAKKGLQRSRSYTAPQRKSWDTKFSPVLEVEQVIEDPSPVENVEDRTQRRLSDWRLKYLDNEQEPSEDLDNNSEGALAKMDESELHRRQWRKVDWWVSLTAMPISWLMFSGRKLLTGRSKLGQWACSQRSRP